MSTKPIDLLVVASRQRFLIRLILVYIFTYLGLMFCFIARLPALFLILFPLILLVLNVVVLVAIINLLAALQYNVIVRILWIFGLFIPLVNLVLLLSANRQATKILKRTGIKVGFMGAPHEDVLRMVSSDLCKHCFYDMTGNVSGICPECGTPWIRPARPVAVAVTGSPIRSPA
jgi:hypothetical protein